MLGIPDGSVDNGYGKRGRKPGRRPDFVNDPEVNARRQKALARLAAEPNDTVAPPMPRIEGADRGNGRLGDVLAFVDRDTT
jgi:hypothetical protein